MNHLRLTSFAPHPDITDGEIKGQQTADLRIGAAGFQVKGVLYDPKGRPRILTLGSADEWTPTGGTPGHPFQIYVNPFKIVAVRNPST
ncbi:hypothetical protein [Bradyrhizobium sp. USDA 4452]